MRHGLRVAFAQYSGPDDIRGVSIWLVEFACRLRTDGIPVAVHLWHQKDHDPSLAPNVERLRSRAISLSTAPAQASLTGDTHQTLAFLNTWQPTVFLPQCKAAHYMAAAAAGDAGLAWALTLHSDDPDYWAVAESLPPSRHGGHTVCVSRHIAKHLAGRSGKGPMSVISYGVALPDHAVSHRGTPFRVAYSGRLWEHQKRAGLVVDTLIRACRASAAMEAVVIGAGHALPACQATVEAAGLSHAIRFTGRLDSQAVQHELADCQAILLMSDFEGLPVALLEAMVLGVVPVVRSIPSGIPELVEHQRTGLLVDADPEQAAKALIRLSADPCLWMQCSRAARQRVARHYNADLSYLAWKELLLALHGRSQVTYPLRVPRFMSARDPDPLLLAPYRRKSRLGPLIRQQWAMRLAQFKHHIRTFIRPG